MTTEKLPCPHCGRLVDDVDWKAARVRSNISEAGIVGGAGFDPVFSVPPGTFTLLPCGHEVNPEEGKAIFRAYGAPEDEKLRLIVPRWVLRSHNPEQFAALVNGTIERLAETYAAEHGKRPLLVQLDAIRLGGDAFLHVPGSLIAQREREDLVKSLDHQLASIRAQFLDQYDRYHKERGE